MYGSKFALGVSSWTELQTSGSGSVVVGMLGMSGMLYFDLVEGGNLKTKTTTISCVMFKLEVDSKEST